MVTPPAMFMVTAPAASTVPPPSSEEPPLPLLLEPPLPPDEDPPALPPLLELLLEPPLGETFEVLPPPAPQPITGRQAIAQAAIHLFVFIWPLSLSMSVDWRRRPGTPSCCVRQAALPTTALHREGPHERAARKITVAEPPPLVIRPQSTG